MIRARHSFPKGFLWGTATASHQVEGGDSGNDWMAWELEPGRVQNGDRVGRACGWWDGEWRGDFDRAANDGHSTIRLSLEWARIEPNPGEFDPSALANYRDMISGALRRGLVPMVTLYHFTNPTWFLEGGGWLADESIESFRRYVRAVLGALGDLTDLWVTINEPNVYAYAAYASGDFPPGRESARELLKVMENQVKGHAAAYEAIHTHLPTARVGMAHHVRIMKPMRPANPFDRWLAQVRSQLFNDSIPRALQTGKMRQLWRTARLPQAKGTQDFFGLNYYTRELVRLDLLHLHEVFDLGHFDPEDEVSPTGFIANSPSGFWESLKYARGFGLPIFVTENGFEGRDDDLRMRYLVQHLRKLWLAANFSWRIEGYYYWTLVDNFEWERGWSQPFGLWELDLATGRRIRRRSADLYSEICRTNSLSADMVRRFTPGLAEHLFPEQAPGEVPSRARDRSRPAGMI